LHIIVAYYPAAAPSDSVFRALCTNSLTYLLFWIYLHTQKFNSNTFGVGRDSIGGGPTVGIGNSNTALHAIQIKI